MEHVVAFDPGGRSGWASARMDVDHFEFTGSGVLREDLMPDVFAEWQRVHYKFAEPRMVLGPNEWETVPLPKARVFDTMVYESWYPWRDEKGQMDWIEGAPLMPVQQIGALRWIARASGAKIATQHPSDKPVAVATMPQEFTVLNRDSNEQHDQDARMHLWLYFWRNWFEGTKTPGETIHV